MEQDTFFDQIIDLIQVLSTPQHDMRQFIQTVLRHSASIFNPQSVALCVLNPQHERFNEYRYEVTTGSFKKPTALVSENINMMRQQSSRIFAVPDVQADENTASQTWLKDRDIQSFWGIGIGNNNDELIGIIFLNYDHTHALASDAHQQQLQIFQAIISTIYRQVWQSLDLQIRFDPKEVDNVVHDWRQSLVVMVKNSLRAALPDACVTLFVYDIDIDYDLDDDDFSPSAFAYSSNEDDPQHYDLRDTIFQELAQRQVIVHNDGSQHPLNDAVARLKKSDYPYWMVIPFTIQTPVGFLLIETRDSEKLRNTHRQWADILPNHITLIAGFELLEHVLNLSQSSSLLKAFISSTDGYEGEIQQALQWLFLNLRCTSVWLAYPNAVIGETTTLVPHIYPPLSTHPFEMDNLPSHEPYFIPRLDSEHLPQGLPFNQAWVDAENIHSAAVLPLIVAPDNKLPAMLVLGFATDRNFTPMQEMILLSIATHVSNALQFSRTIEINKLEKHQREAVRRRALVEINIQKELSARPYDVIKDAIKRAYQKDGNKIYIHFLRDASSDGEPALRMDHVTSDISRQGNNDGRRITAGVCVNAFKNDQTIIVKDVQQYEGHFEAYHPDTRSELAIPIRAYQLNPVTFGYDYTIIGVLNIESTAPHTFDEFGRGIQDNLITELIDLIPIAWQNADRFQKADERQRLLDSVQSMRTLLIRDHSNLSLQSVIDALLRQAFELSDKIHLASLYFIDKDGKYARIYDAKPDPNYNIVGVQQEIDETIQNGAVDYVVQLAMQKPDHRPHYVVEDIQHNPPPDLHYSGDDQTHSEAVYALMDYNNNLKAVLNLESRDIDAFPPNVREALEIFATEAELSFQQQERNYVMTVGQMADGILHDLQNEISAIDVNFKQVIEYIDKLHKQLDKLGESYEAKIRGSDGAREIIERMNARVQGRATLMRQLREHGSHLTIEKQRKPLSALLSYIEAWNKTDQAKFPLIITLPDSFNPHAIKLDLVANTIESSLDNLLTNGSQAMERRAKKNPENQFEPLIHIEVQLMETHKQVVIAISDKGDGIPKDDIAEKIYSPTYTKQVGGSGMGLVQVKWFVEWNDGKIDCLSELGEGTTFTITLPCTISA